MAIAEQITQLESSVDSIITALQTLRQEKAQLTDEKTALTEENASLKQTLEQKLADLAAAEKALEEVPVLREALQQKEAELQAEKERVDAIAQQIDDIVLKLQCEL